MEFVWVLRNQLLLVGRRIEICFSVKSGGYSKKLWRDASCVEHVSFPIIGWEENKSKDFWLSCCCLEVILTELNSIIIQKWPLALTSMNKLSGHLKVFAENFVSFSKPPHPMNTSLNPLTSRSIHCLVFVFYICLDDASFQNFIPKQDRNLDLHTDLDIIVLDYFERSHFYSFLSKDTITNNQCYWRRFSTEWRPFKSILSDFQSSKKGWGFGKYVCVLSFLL